jgi:hypothetical protein
MVAVKFFSHPDLGKIFFSTAPANFDGVVKTNVPVILELTRYP